MTIKKPVDLVTAAVLLAGTGFVYRESLKIDITTVYALGPRFFPNVLMLFLIILSVALGLQSIDFSSNAPKAKKSASTFSPAVLAMQASCIGLVVAYLIALPLLTYIPSTILFLLASMCLLGKRTVKDIVLYAVIGCAVAGLLYYIFAQLLLLFLP